MTDSIYCEIIQLPLHYEFIQFDIPFDSAMLQWPAGGIAEDGVWAAHWYGAVHRSTGFAGAESALPKLDASYDPVLEQALPIYEQLRASALSF